MPLVDARPSLAEEWHPARNGDLRPDTVAVTSNRKVWWLGACGHEWQAVVSNRTNGSGCPFCAGKALLSGFNDLATTHPDLAAQWSRRNDVSPTEVRSGSETAAWWLGDCGHEWRTAIRNRTRSGSGCPFCAGKAVLPGFNDLATTHPDLAAQWHPDRNGDLTPESVTAGSSKTAWWLGDCGHEWEATPNRRRTDIPGCPVCSGHRVLRGTNDLATTHPGLAAQWHPDRNGDLTPESVTAGSNRKAWWRRSECGHEWESFIYDRAGSKQTGCPRCVHRVSKGEDEVYDVLRGLIGPRTGITRNCRIDGGCELDLIVDGPGSPLAIEYNGVFWHSARFRGRSYHADKQAAAIAAGYRFFAIWEDDWQDRRDIVTAALAHRLGVARELPAYRRLGARSLTPALLGRDAADAFLEGNHIQGAAPRGVSHLGLFDSDDAPVAVLSIRESRTECAGAWEIVRYATSGSVAGGFTRLLAFAERETPDIVSWVTFADKGISDGGLYESTGFTVSAVLAPDYAYAGNRTGWRRKHKSAFRLDRFRTDAGLIYKEGATERELAQLNGLERVWDHGKVKYARPALRQR